MPPSEHEEQIIRYLLDQLGVEERTQLEERLFREPSFFESVSSVEDDLIMQYVRGDLDGRLVARFNEVYLNSPAKLARIESARVLRQAVRDAVKKSPSAVLKNRGLRLLWMAAAALVVLAAVLWPFLTNHSPGPVPAPREVAFSLEPGLVRSGGGVSIRVPQGTRVRFTLVVADAAAHKNYRVIAGTPERPNIWSGAAVVKATDLMTVVPADVLSAGDYSLQLQANDGGDKWENVATYYFRVER